MEAVLGGLGPLRDRVILTDYVPDADLAPLYSGALGFLYLSRHEGFGLPPLEAMQCGVPVITSGTSSLPEVVGDAGLMFDPDDRAGQVAAIRALADDPQLAARLSAQGIRRAAQFSWEGCVDRMMEGYRRALGGSGGRRRAKGEGRRAESGGGW